MAGRTRLRDPRSDDAAQRALTRYTLVTHLLDQAARVPGTSFRFGLDAIIGLLPGFGDAVTALVGMYGLVVARQLGAPASIQLRMLWNLGLDTVVGAIPLFGDLFDFAFKANTKNRILLERWLVSPHTTHRTSALLLLAMLALLIGLIVGAVWLAYALLRALVGGAGV
jgi:uncharacterized protein DUF4112